MKKIVFAITLIFLGFANVAYGQEEAEEQEDTTIQVLTLAMQSRTETNRVILRWAPGNYSLFRHGAETGYTIQRRAYTKNPEVEYSEETDVDKGFKDVATILPWTNEQWQAGATDSADIYAGVAMQILLGGEAKPKDGGEMNEISSYYENQQRKFAYGLISADLSETAALGLGLRYDDTDVKPGYFYEYRVMFSQLPIGFNKDTAWSFADMTRPAEPYKVDHAFLEAGDKNMTVYWTRHNDQFFTAYDVERSLDKVNWTKLNDKPWMTSFIAPETPNFFVDSLEENHKTYYYRIIGYTPFGDKGAYSDILADKGVDQTPPAPAWGVQADDMGGYVAIHWDAAPDEPDFDGFYVERSDAPNGYFERISEKLPAEARDFADLMPVPLSSNYYRVITIDKLGNEAPSFSELGYLIDSMPPEKPTGLIGSIDTTGIVALDWTPGPEMDIIGYRVYWSNDKETEFTQIVGDVIPGINFVDSINIATLNEEIYYKIVAVDHRYNHSEYSDVLSLRKPDIVPPAEPLIHGYKVTDESIEFNWYVSVSEDVEKQVLWRKAGDGVWEIHSNSLGLADTTFVDNDVKKGQAYSYKIVATDDAGNQSESQILQATVVDDGFRKTDLTATITVKNNSAVLRWTGSTEQVKYVLYRNRDGQQMKLANLYTPDSTWTDNNYIAGDTYQMRIMFPNGDESQLILFSQN